jgi:hypothetical protein
MDVLEQILTSVPELEELCFISHDSYSPEISNFAQGKSQAWRSKIDFHQRVYEY